jgi:hypothetical protein
VLQTLAVLTEEILAKTRRVVALLDELELQIARVGQGYTELDVSAIATILEVGDPNRLGIEPGTDTERYPMGHGGLYVADDVAVLARRSKDAAQLS